MLQAGEPEVRGIWAEDFRSFSNRDGIIFPSCKFKVLCSRLKFQLFKSNKKTNLCQAKFLFESRNRHLQIARALRGIAPLHHNRALISALHQAALAMLLAVGNQQADVALHAEKARGRNRQHARDDFSDV